jgi:hypothetical protein
MSEDLEQGISYAKAIPVDALADDLNLVDEDDDALPPDDSPDAGEEAGLTDQAAAALVPSEVRFEFDESGVAR